MRSWMLMVAAAAGLAPVASAPARAGLAGSTVEVVGYFTTRDPLNDPLGVIVGPTTAMPDPAMCNPAVDSYCTIASTNPPNGPTTEVVPTTTPLWDAYSTLTMSSISDSQITVTSTLQSGSSLFCSSNLPCTDLFDGLVYVFSGNTPITDVTVSQSTSLDFEPYSVTWNANTIWVNLIGASPASPPLAGDELVLDVFTAARVPEPSTWALMIVGFAGLGWIALRRSGRARGQTHSA